MNRPYTSDVRSQSDFSAHPLCCAASEIRSPRGEIATVVPDTPSTKSAGAVSVTRSAGRSSDAIPCAPIRALQPHAASEIQTMQQDGFRLHNEHGREFRLKQLERDLAIVFEIVAQVHRGHAAFAEMVENAIAKE